jgi:hypothetical protein
MSESPEPDNSDSEEPNAGNAAQGESDKNAKSETDPHSFDELSHEERVQVVFSNAGEAVQQIREEWEEERVQVYFFFYSFAMVGLMLFLLYQNLTKLLIGAFAIYVITILPLLYIYEEEKYFQSDQFPVSNED